MTFATRDAPWTVAPEPADSPVATDLWRMYCTEVSDRWYLRHEGHRTVPEELEREVVAANDGDLLRPPTGLLLVARHESGPAGTAGIRLVDADTAELKRLFVREDLRGAGGGVLLVRAAEDAARALGARRMILETRHDLTEARALYARHGYADTAPFSSSAYSEHWLAKPLG